MDKSSELAKALSKMPNYTKALKLNVGIQPLQQSSETILSHEYPLSAAFHKSKKKEGGVLSREGSPRPRQKRRQQKDAFNLSCKYPVLKKEFQSENERDATAFNRTSDKAEIKHLASLLGASAGSRELGVGVGGGKKSGHSHTYTHLNDDSDKFSDADNTFYRPQYKTKFRHSKSPSKERHTEHNNTSYAEQRPPPLLARTSSIGEPSVEALLREISRLEGVIASYQAVLLKLKHQYLQLEERVAEKALNDHYIDVLKRQLEQAQENNYRLTLTLQTQRHTIGQFQDLLVERIRQVREHYEAEVQEGLQMARENQFLKRLMMIATHNPESPPISKTAYSKPEPPSPPPPAANAFLRTMSKSVEEFSERWK